MYKLLLATLFTAALLAAGYSYELNRQLDQLQLGFEKQKAIDEATERNLKNEIEVLKAKLLTIESLKTQNSSSILPAETKMSSTSEPLKNKLSRPEWKAKLSLRRVEKRLALTSDERRQLEEKFGDGDKLTALSSVIGEERAKKFFDEEESSRKAEEEEALKEKLFKLSRVLGLNSKQETQVTKVLKNSREILKDPYETLKQEEERAIDLHSEPNSGDELRAVYEKYRIDLEKITAEENAILSKRLKGILTEDQLNKLLEYQATEDSGLK